ncbi:MAG TPA: hypothetical protein VG013_24165 [Gemmataceae bacterium]|jgi:hypothetical protein|nr:hypothetical protein [Gemmataceae bacterium]
MRTIHTLQQSGPDKAIHLTIPVEEAHYAYRLVITIEPEPPLPVKTPEELGWPPGYFEQTAGAIQDETFTRPPQGEVEKRLEIE